MARKKNEDIMEDDVYEEQIEPLEEDDEEEVSPEEIAEAEEEIEDKLEDEAEDRAEDNAELSEEIQEQYGSPEVEQKDNQWSITRKAIDSRDTVRVTYLEKEELGRPFFSVRFLMDLQDLALHYKCPRIADYFLNKISNVTDSGMSNKGFIMNLTATQKRDQVKRRIREVPNNLNGKGKE